MLLIVFYNYYLSLSLSFCLSVIFKSCSFKGPIKHSSISSSSNINIFDPLPSLNSVQSESTICEDDLSDISTDFSFDVPLDGILDQMFNQQSNYDSLGLDQSGQSGYSNSGSPVQSLNIQRSTFNDNNNDNNNINNDNNSTINNILSNNQG